MPSPGREHAGTRSTGRLLHAQRTRGIALDCKEAMITSQVREIAKNNYTYMRQFEYGTFEALVSDFEF